MDLEFTGIDQNQLNHMIKIISYRINKFSRKDIIDNTNKNNEYNKNKTNILFESPENDFIFHIKFKYNNYEFEKKFVSNNTIGHIKTYIRKKLSHKNVYIFSTNPRKDYNDDNITINKSGIDKNQVLFVSLV